eukprot:gene16430-22402_t
MLPSKSPSANLDSSNSSFDHRQLLKQNYVIVPDVSPIVSIQKYLQLTQTLFQQAVKFYSNCEYASAYIDFQKILALMVNIKKKHHSYNDYIKSNKSGKTELDRIIINTKPYLEETVRQMDREEDERISQRLDAALMEAFDDENQSKSNNQNIQQSEIEELNKLSSSMSSLQPVIANVFEEKLAQLSLMSNRIDDDNNSNNNTVSKQNTNEMNAFDLTLLTQSVPRFPFINEHNVINNANDNSCNNNNNTNSNSNANSNSNDNDNNSNVSNSTLDLNVNNKLHILKSIDMITPTPNSLMNPSAPLPHQTVNNNNINNGYVVPEFKFVNEEEPVKTLKTGTVVAKVPVYDILILKHIQDYRSFPIPRPFSCAIELILGNIPFKFIQIDFQVSFQAFLQSIPPDLQVSRSAIETNRCFFLHLGVALSIHPFVLQTVLRYYASIDMFHLKDTDSWKQDILHSILEYAGLVDANAMIILWLKEFNNYRICLISGPLNRPIFSCFTPIFPNNSNSTNKLPLTDVIIRCSGTHFTLLKPFENDGRKNQ